jgi:hypothetical protein
VNVFPIWNRLVADGGYVTALLNPAEKSFNGSLGVPWFLEAVKVILQVLWAESAIGFHHVVKESSRGKLSETQRGMAEWCNEDFRYGLKHELLELSLEGSVLLIGLQVLLVLLLGVSDYRSRARIDRHLWFLRIMVGSVAIRNGNVIRIRHKHA